MPRRYFRKKTQEWVTYNYPKGGRKQAAPPPAAERPKQPSKIQRLREEFTASVQQGSVGGDNSAETPPKKGVGDVPDEELDDLLRELLE